jgi:hypothetical protein
MHLSYDITKSVVAADMRTADTLMDSVASGHKRMQLICSASGFGKTSIAKKRFRQYGIVSEKEFYRSLSPLPDTSRPQTRQTGMRRAVLAMRPFESAKKRLFIEARPTKPISLVRTLHQCSMLQASALLFDDPGRIAGDEAACDILKTAFGMQRTVTFETPEITRNENWRISGHGGYDPFVPPPDFPVPDDLGWLWLANVNYTDPSVLAKLGDHFAPLIARGLNPFWIRDDAEHDHHDLFLYVHWLATEENLLRSMGFPYEVSRKAVNFYVTHAHRLVDLCPRRLELIAQAFAADQPPVALEAELNSMAPSTIIRPKLRLPASWVTVTDGVPSGELIWPEQPFSKNRPVTENDPPRRIRKRERDWKRTHAEPASEPPPANDDPERPESPPAASLPHPSNEVETVEPPLAARPVPEPSADCCSVAQAIDAVYRRIRDHAEFHGGDLTCDMVAGVLEQFPLAEWDTHDLVALREGLNGCSNWIGHEALADVYFQYDRHTTKLYASADAVLTYGGAERGLQIHSWSSIEQQLTPALADEWRRADEQQRAQRCRDIFSTRLPKVRKLKAMKLLLDEILACQPTISELGQQMFEYIRAMSRDDPQFAKCTTFEQYFDKVLEIFEQVQEGSSRLKD